MALVTTPPCCFEKVFESCFPRMPEEEFLKREPSLLQKLARALGVYKYQAHTIMDAPWTGSMADTMVRTPKDHGMSFEDVRFPASDGCQIAAWYIPAQDPSSKKLAIVGHQSWACANKSGCVTHRRHGLVTVEAIDYVKLHRVLFDAGYHVVAYDLRNHGESEKRLPSGFGEIEYMDALGVMTWVNSHAVLKTCKVALLPFCVSGIAFLKANSLAPDKFKNVFAWVTTNILHIPTAVGNRPYLMGLGSAKLANEAFQEKQAQYVKDGLLKNPDVHVTMERISAKKYAPDVKVPVLYCDAKHDLLDYHEQACPDMFAEFGKSLPDSLKGRNEFHFLDPGEPLPFKTRGRNRSEGYNFYQSENGRKVLLDFLSKHCP
ncbi:unnamed protein product [Symbiodinium natans]|uniref:Serine aminopeptidase S33 domain-containing protein n=1 Tax=Symbiodinium natans TaxID=878477 RepID=A0A812J5Y6_9DINO|nr:unnamed protein product [Symbiodinium natans]